MYTTHLKTNIIYRLENVDVDDIGEIEKALLLEPNTIDLRKVPAHTKRVSDLIVMIGYPEKGHTVSDA